MRAQGRPADRRRLIYYAQDDEAPQPAKPAAEEPQDVPPLVLEERN